MAVAAAGMVAVLASGSAAAAYCGDGGWSPRRGSRAEVRAARTGTHGPRPGKAISRGPGAKATTTTVELTATPPYDGGTAEATTPPTLDAPATTMPPAPATTAPPTPPPSAPAVRPAPSPLAPAAWAPSGPVYWVAPEGDDGANGSATSPWRTFAHALGRLRPGDTLLVRGGTYGSYGTTQIMNVEGVNGRAGAPITIAANPGEHVRLLGGGWDVVRVGNSSHVDIRGFDVSGDAHLARSTTNGIAVGDSHHIGIYANTVHDLGGGGIGTARANHVTIDGNHVYNVAMWNENQSSGISLWNSTNIGGGDNTDGFSFYIRNNLVHDARNRVGGITDGNCIIVDSNRDNGYAGSTYIANNVCRNNGGRGVHVFIADNVFAYNNTLVGNLRSPELADGGELSANTASNVHFRNNLVIPAADRARQGATVWRTSNITFAHNVYAGADHGLLGAGDRLVHDAGVNGEFVPQPGSPAIDAGTPDGAPTTDRRGRARSGAPDAGAYEA